MNCRIISVQIETFMNEKETCHSHSNSNFHAILVTESEGGDVFRKKDDKTITRVSLTLNRNSSQVN